MQHNLIHLAIIMDGNARWATQNGKTRSEGHSVGAQNAKKILQHALKLSIQYLTLYAFSSENWTRPDREVSMLLSILNHYIRNEANFLQKHHIKLQVIGDLTRLPRSLMQKITEITGATKNNKKITVTIAFSYGAREEIANACQKAINLGVKKITEKNFKEFLYDPKMPNVDALVRTSGTHRVSNFLLWQISYAEIYFLDKFWPDFNEEDLNYIMDNYSKKIRNFGSR